jgi:hypothetical protein
VTEIQNRPLHNDIDYQIARMVKARERVLTGALVLNATAVTAVFSALQNGEKALAALQISDRTSSVLILIFLVGIIFAAAATVCERWSTHSVTQFALVKDLRKRMVAATFEGALTDEIREGMKESRSAAQWFFNRFRLIQNAGAVCVALSSSAWFAGMTIAVVKIVHRAWAR